MRIKEVRAEKVLDSRNEETISVFVRTDDGIFSTSSPSGKSKGKNENPSYIHSIQGDINALKDFEFQEIEHFKDLEQVESQVNGKIGANTLFALEASMLKALAHHNNLPLWKFLNEKASRVPFPLGNVIGGGMHSQGIKPDIQEFLIMPMIKNFSDNVFVMQKAWEIAGKTLEARGIKQGLNDEGAWQTNLENEGCLNLMGKIRDEVQNEIDEKIELGIDVASSSFFNYTYNYKNPARRLKTKEQVRYIGELAEKYMLSYIEDPLQEEDFDNFAILRKGILAKRPCLIVGDDLITSKLSRLQEAIKKRSIGAVIVKPNQVGSLIEIANLVKLAKKYEIACVMSHRSGETTDNTIADLAVALQCEFIKTGIHGKEREAKLNRLIEIEKSL